MIDKGLDTTFIHFGIRKDILKDFSSYLSHQK